MTTQEQNMLQEEKNILSEEKEMVQEMKKEEGLIKRLIRNVWIISGAIALGILLIIGIIVFFISSSRKVSDDQAQISAPVINLAPDTEGVLEQIFVNDGDYVNTDTVVARVGNELIKTQTAGIIISADDQVGTIFNPGETVISMINPNDLRVVAHLDENKGLDEIAVGDRAVFTVDAFGSKKFSGVVDEISPSARASDVVFNISDERETQEFDVKIRFDTTLYPELKNGMSAKVTIYKN